MNGNRRPAGAGYRVSRPGGTTAKEFHPVGFLRLLLANPVGWQKRSRISVGNGETVPLTGGRDLSNVTTRCTEALAGPFPAWMEEGVAG
jgi:hypothetical protein